jgi:hypothetical protein
VQGNCTCRFEPLGFCRKTYGLQLHDYPKATEAETSAVPGIDDFLRAPLTFHRDELRHEFYRTGPRPPVFDRRTGYWLVTDPLDCVTILTSMPVVAPPTQSDEFEKRTGLDLSILVSLDRQMPLSLEGEQHQLARRGVAEFIGGRRREIRTWFEGGLKKHFSALGRPGRVEVMTEIMQPMILDFLTAFLGVDMHRIDMSLVSKLLDNSMRLKKRIEGIGQVSEVKRYLGRETGLDLDGSLLNIMALMTMFGKDSLTSTFGESLRWELLQAPGKAFKDMAFKELPPVAGVPFCDRLVIAPFRLAGAEFLAGQHVRVFIQAFQYYDDMMQTHRYFGAGAHVCPGRAISVEFWRGITTTLNRFSTTASILSYEVDDSDNVFASPKTLLLELRDSQ